jgi:hypothetical protein
MPNMFTALKCSADPMHGEPGPLKLWSGCSGAYCTAMCGGGCGLICIISVAGVAIAACVSLVEGNAGNNMITP